MSTAKAKPPAMEAKKIPLVDLYHLVTDHCGAVYDDCDICRRTPCSYHYNDKGETMQGDFVAKAIKARLDGA